MNEVASVARLVIAPPPLPADASVDTIAGLLRERYEHAIAKTWAQYAHPHHWNLFTAYLMTCLIKEQAKCDWDTATDAGIKHFPELFSEYWYNLPYDPAERLAPLTVCEFSPAPKKQTRQTRKRKEKPLE